jgi:hypothetical protein
MKRIEAALLALMLSGCVSTYSLRAEDIHRLRNGAFSAAEGVPATRDRDGRAVRLKASVLDGVDLGLGDSPVRLRPRTTRTRRDGYIVLGIGGALALGAVIAAVTGDPPGCHDETCWMPRLTAGLTLGILGGALVVAGGAMAISGSPER